MQTMIKVTKTKVFREITLDEFTSQKNTEPYAGLRQLGKSINFLMIFGGSARVFVNSGLEMKWSPQQALDFIKVNHLQKLHEDLKDRYKRDTPEMIAYLTVATFIRERFFKTYPGLMKRIKDNQAFAKEHGYVRSYFGATRKLIEEMLRGSYDEKEHGAHMRNLDNVCANTDIQNFEASIAHPAMVKLDLWLEENHKKSRIFNFVHDAIDVYVYKPELLEVCEKMKEFMTCPVPELKGIPLAVDFAIADISKGEYYKHGHSLEHFL